MHWPNDPNDDGNALFGACLALLLETGIAAFVVAVVMLLN